MSQTRSELAVLGMDCAECTLHVRQAIAALPGVRGVEVFLAAEKAVVDYDAAQVDLPAIRKAVQSAGYQAPAAGAGEDVSESLAQTSARFGRAVLWVLGLVFGAVLLVVVAGEWLGLFEAVTARVPWPIGWLIVFVGWVPVLRNVIAAARRGQATAHTLMSLGVLAALVVGEWTTAAIVVFFMRVGDYVEHFTAERARRAVKDLTALAPKQARVLRDGVEAMVAVDQVAVGEVVVVRPGEQIPVDGVAVEGSAMVDQATLTGEPLPAEAGPGTRVFAATLVRLGSLRVRAEQVGRDTTFGRVIRMVEDAERHRADVQRLADRFSAYFLPFVGLIALLTFVLRRDPLATAAVLVVACSCAIALATPIAVLASIGAGAKRGLLVKGGKYLELLDRADVLLIDKTGTLTLGQPQITDVVSLDGMTPDTLLALAAGAERYSEHPLAEAVRRASQAHGQELAAPSHFEALPGFGVRAQIDGRQVTVGSRRILAGGPLPAQAQGLEADGKTLLYVTVDGQPQGVLAATDTIRPEVPAALAALRGLGIERIELLTGDNPRTAAALAEPLGVAYQAELLPADKLEVVRRYQAQGKTVVMVGDGVNDAPALAQADVGIAMGAAGSDIAAEAAHVVLLRDDWALVPEALRIARRTMRVVRTNIGYTLVYNLVGLTAAALGWLSPVFAAVAQSIPDLIILANSSRLLRQK
ncbi:MAG: cadmium-translocating P-type ATPase [Chloroflexi bacterium]|nr:MAG: cadmium-translocating P-type ATPase [Chloroflexota bacterium]